MSTITRPLAAVRVGAPQTAGPLSVFPLFRAQADAPRLEYRALAQAVAEGLVVRELEDGASVRDLTVVNPLEVPVLLYDGEEVLGAQQNRTLDSSVLVPAGARLRVPVSCVEAGRWDGGRHADAFAAAPQAAHPSLRASTSRQRARAAGAEDRADQAAVWSEVAALSQRRGVASATGAMHDVRARSRRHRRDARRRLPSGPPGRGGRRPARRGGGHGLRQPLRRVGGAVRSAGPGVRARRLDGRPAGYPTVVGEDINRAWVQAWVDGLLMPVEVRARCGPGLAEHPTVRGGAEAATAPSTNSRG